MRRFSNPRPEDLFQNAQVEMTFQRVYNSSRNQIGVNLLQYAGAERAHRVIPQDTQTRVHVV